MVLLTISTERQFAQFATTARQRAAEGRELEIGVLGHALSLRVYVQSGDETYKEESQVRAQDVESHLAEYTRLAQTPTQHQFAAEFGDRWKAFRASTKLVLADPGVVGNADVLALIATQRRELISFLNDRLQADAIATVNERKAVAEEHIKRHILTGAILLLAGFLVASLTAGTIARAILRTEREVYFERERLRATLASIGDGVITTDVAGRVTSLNAVAQALTGWDQDQAARQPLEDVFRIINEETRAEVANPALRALEEGMVVGLANHTLLISKDGTERPIDDSAAPIKDSGGATLGSVLVFRDINERKVVEQKFKQYTAELASINALLRDRGEELQLLLNTIPIGVFIAHDPACTVITCNPAGATMLAVRADINVSKSAEGTDQLPVTLPFKVMRDGFEVAAEDLPMQRAAREGRPIVGEEVDLVHADGRVVTLCEYAAPLFNASGKVRGCLGTFIDITERKRVETAIREAKDRPELATQAAALGIWSWDTRTDLVVWENDVTARIMGVPTGDPPVGRDRYFAEFLHPEDRPAMEEAMARTVRDAVPFATTCRLRRPGGEWRHVEFTGKSVGGAGGRITGITGIIGTIQDITQRKHEQHLLAESEARYRTLFESIDQGFSIIEMIPGESGKPIDYNILEANPAFVRFTGLNDYRRGTVLELLPGLEPWWIENYGRIAMTGEAQRFEQYAATLGKWYEVYAFRFGAPDRLQVAIFFKDITERKQAAEAQRASEERLQMAMVAGEAGVWDLDLVSGRNLWSRSHFIMLGYEPTPTFEASEAMWKDCILPEDLASVLNEWERAQRERTLFRSEHRIRRADDGAIIWVRAAGQFMYHQVTHRSVRFIGVLFDITLQKTREQTIKDIDRRKDEFLAMLSHELRNPLAPIRAALHLLRAHESADEHPICKEAREIIERQTATLTRLVGEMLDMSRVASSRILLQRTVVDLNKIISHAIETSKPLIDAQHHTLTLHLHPTALQADVDPVRIEQVVVNLLINAAKYTPEGGRIEISSDVAVGADGSRRARIRVRDNGMGIEAQLQPHVFDLFTQSERALDRSQGGLGIGLSLCQRLVEMHGGTIAVRSEGPGRGAEFIFELPMLNKDIDVRIQPITAVRAQHAEGKVRVLLVDDNSDLLSMLSFGLRARGFIVETAVDGHQGLKAAIASQPDVLILDIGLPGMSGYELARRLRTEERTKSARLIALSGYGQETDAAKAKAAGFDAYVTKPVDLEELIKLMQLSS